MNNEETIIMQPQKSGASEQKVNNVEETKNEATPQVEKKGNTGKRVAAMAAAGMVGGAMGGAGSVAAANMMDAEEPEVQAEEVEAAPAAEAHEEIPVTVDDGKEEDYANEQGADPVVDEPLPSDETPESEVQVLGVYENADGQEMAVLTDGETVAAVLDANGDGEANYFAVDENHDGQFQEGEIHDVTDQHISMQPIEQDYLAQQQMEAEQHDTFAYEATDEPDYDNDAPVFDA